MNSTIEYYNKNAQDFSRSTVDVDFRVTQDAFLACLPEHAFILDFGCGSGRDTRYFRQQGYEVEATDGSEELCRIASEYTSHPVKKMLFQDLDAVERYDGIWACASILHINSQMLRDVLQNMLRALKKRGIIYASFKYGTFEGVRNGRYFTDFTEDSFYRFIGQFPGVTMERQWITTDVRPDRGEEKWLNILLRKN